MISASHVWHLAARFATSLPPTPPSVGDEVWVDRYLSSGERRLWTQMSNRDRRHSALVGRRFVERRPDAPRAAVAGAILHDVGKVQCGLGTVARVVATIMGPRTRRFRLYHDHEEIGAAMVASAGSDPITVELVRGDGPFYADLCAGDRA